MKLLVVEDDEKAGAYLKKGLGEQGFVVDLARDGEEGLHLAREFRYDGLIVDLMLPKRDGWSLVSELRKDGSQVPILMLTARDAVEDRVRGLDTGSDDYLCKPFAFSELVARIRSLIRRGGARREEIWRVGDLEVDIVRHRASRGGRVLDLTPKEFLLLALLGRRSGEILSRTLIAEQIWDINFDSDTNVIDVHVRRLRHQSGRPVSGKADPHGSGHGVCS